MTRPGSEPTRQQRRLTCLLDRPLCLEASERAALYAFAWKVAGTRMAERAWIILWLDSGLPPDAVAERLGCHIDTVLLWRTRFLERRADGVPACMGNLNPHPRRRATPKSAL